MFNNFYKSRRVLLTGHTGFKGSWLSEWLLMLGADVHGYALDPQPHEILFNQLGLSDRLAADHRGDIADLPRLKQLVADTKPDVIFHLAAQPLVRLSYDQPVETFATNVIGTVNLLEAVRHSSHPCTVVCITTDKCYENREWLHAYREEDPMGGHDPYSASKGAAELVIASYRRSFFSSPTSDLHTPSSSSSSSDLRPSTFRPLDSSPSPSIRLASARAGNVIGGGDWALDRIVPDCIRAIRAGQTMPVRNKIATRPWQHVLEPLSGYLLLAASLASSSSSSSSDLRPSTFRPLDSSTSSSTSPDSDYRPLASSSALSSAFNFGPNITSNRTVAELVQELLKHTGGEWSDASDPNAVHEASKLNLATDKAFHLLGWQPVWNFEETIAQTAGWYLKEQQVADTHALTLSQIQAYHQAATAKGLDWAKDPWQRD